MQKANNMLAIEMHNNYWSRATSTERGCVGMFLWSSLRYRRYCACW